MRLSILLLAGWLLLVAGLVKRFGVEATVVGWLATLLVGGVLLLLARLAYLLTGVFLVDPDENLAWKDRKGGRRGRNAG